MANGEGDFVVVVVVVVVAVIAEYASLIASKESIVNRASSKTYQRKEKEPLHVVIVSGVCVVQGAIDDEIHRHVVLSSRRRVAFVNILGTTVWKESL